MLLNNNGPPTADAVYQQHHQQSNNVVFRRPKNEASNQQQQRNNNKSSGSKKDNKNRGAGGSQAVRNSWSFTNEQQYSQQQQLPIQQQPVIKESIYADPDALFNGNIGEQLKSVSRSRLRQRSVSNLTAASLAGTRSRDHSSSNRHHQSGSSGQNGAGGTVSAKGVDYIRIHHMTTTPQQQQQQVNNSLISASLQQSGHVVRPSVLALQHPVTTTTPTTDVVTTAGTTSTIINALLSPVVQQQQQMQDRSEYGNPDGSSAHSTAEREAGGLTTSKSADPILPADIYTAINQNTSNDFKMMNQQQQNYLMSHQEEQMTTSALIRLGSGRASSSSSSTTNNTANTPTPTTSTPTQRFPPPSASTGKSSSSSSSSTEVHNRKSTSASAGGASVVAGPNAVKTEWTFLPSPTAAVEPQQQHLLVHREINSKPEESSMVRKGLLWVMRDRIFSRYHERFCILTRNYLHCFKKGSEVSLTQMGNFLFKVSLAEVTAVQWLDKKGTAIVCLTLAKEGRLLVKTSMDLNGWYDDFQTGVKETIGRRQTLLHDQRRGGETFNGSTVVAPSRHIIAAGQQQQPHQVPLRDRSLAARNRSANRFSLMSDHDIKSTAAGMNNHGPASEITNKSADPASGLSVEPHSLCYSVPPQIVPSSSSSKSSSATPVPTPTTASGPPVPVPYRERSVSFDRSRASKAEREAKRRSYYPSSHVTQV